MGQKNYTHLIHTFYVGTYNIHSIYIYIEREEKKYEFIWILINVIYLYLKLHLSALNTFIGEDLCKNYGTK